MSHNSQVTTIREIEVSKKNNLKFAPLMERSLKALKENFLPLPKVFLEVENSQMKKVKVFQHLILEETTTKLKEKN